LIEALSSYRSQRWGSQPIVPHTDFPLLTTPQKRALEVLDFEEKNLDYNKSWGQQDSDTKVPAMDNREGRLAEEFLKSFAMSVATVGAGSLN
jgi:hypothetical protein